MQTMGTSPGTCEIIELMEELDSAQDLKETNRLSCGVIMGNKDELFLVGTTAYKYTLDDDINKLFEAIDHRASARGLHTSRKWNTKSPSTKPISSSLSQASGIGISESVTLKQALRGLCISHASEIAAMKRLSELVVGSSYVSKAGSIKRMYRAVVVEADESGSPLNEGKGSSLELSIGPEQSKVDPFKNISLPETREKSMSPNVHSSPFKVASSTEVSMTEAPLKKIVPVSAEIVKRTPLWKLRQNGGLNSALSLSRLKSQNKTTKVEENFSASMETGSIKSMLKLGKNLKLNSLYSSFSSTAGVKVNTSSQNSAIAVNPVRKSECYLEKKIKEPDIRCTKTFSVDDNSGMCSSESQLTQNVAKVSPPALCSGCLKVDVSSSFADSRTNKSGFLLGGYSRRDMDGKASECSRSREPAEFSQSSKCSVGEFSNCTSVSEESNSCASSCSGSRAHMAKDFRWDAVHHVEMVHGSLGLKHFKLLKQLGSGDVGTVYLAELIGTGCLFAVKVMDTDSLGSRKKISRARTERDILQILDHPFLPTLYAHFTTNKYSVLVMEYCPGGDLHVLRQKQPGGTFTEQAARFYVAEILLALEYLHMLGIVYRDLKPENILIREDGHIMLSDFDLSLRCTVKPTLLAASSCTIAPTKKQSHPCMDFRCIGDFCLKSSGVQVPCFTSRFLSTSNKRKMLKSNVAFQIPQILAEPTNARSNSFVGTHEYLAPEIIRGEGHGNAVDWWTFGIFLYELLFGVTPFKGFGDEETLSNVVMHSINFPASPSVSSQAKDLIKGLLVKEPQDRFGSVKGAAEIKKHPFFEGLNWALIRCAGPPLLPKSCDSGGLLLASVDSNPVERNKTMKEDTEFELF